MPDRFGVEAASGITLAADRWIGDGPPVVLLHAGVCDRRSFTDVEPALEDADVVAYDRRGFGESPADAADFRHLAARVPAITRTHVFEGAAHVPTLERPAEVAQVIAQALRDPHP